MDILIKYLNLLTKKVSELKRKASEAWNSKNYFNPFIKKNFNQLENST